jgi:hypothetical protein
VYFVRRAAKFLGRRLSGLRETILGGGLSKNILWDIKPHKDRTGQDSGTQMKALLPDQEKD